MKRTLHDIKKLACITLCIVLTGTLTAQTIRRVNNNPGVSGLNVYTTAQAAHDAAAANDILYIEPTSSDYGSLTITKPLKLIGNGYFLDTNTELRIDPRSSKLTQIILNTGSDGTSLQGLECTTIFVYGVSNISITRCKLTGTEVRLHNRDLGATTNTNVTNITISQNFLRYIVSPEPSVSVSHTVGFTISNVLVSNNHMTHLLAGDGDAIQNWTVKNNIYFSGITTELANSVFENNIMEAAGSVSFINVIPNYNISPLNTFTGGTGNQNDVDITAEWLGGTSGISTDEYYQFKPGSPLRTAGNGGTEVGPYGGTTPYVVSGIPAIPSISGLSHSGTGSDTVPLQITISIKSNN